MALIQNVLDTLVSRRTFLKGSAAAIGTASFALNATAIAESNTLKATGEETIPVAAEPVVGEDGGKWVAAPCWHNCGGKCLVKAYVKDGVILRQKTDDYNTDDECNRQQRSCLRGFSQQYQARGLDRLK